MENKNNRRPIDNSVRWQVFERDKFTCQYCGRSSPDIELEIDHYIPVSKGGTNDINNLKTSCRSCNEGKSDRAPVKIDYLEPTENEPYKKTDYEFVLNEIKNRIDGYELNQFSKNSIRDLFFRFTRDEIMVGVRESAEKYLQRDFSGQLTAESVELFIEKIGGVCVYKKKTPAEQRISWTKGIARRRFHNWNPREGAILLCEYLKVLQCIEYTEKQIVNDFNNWIIQYTKNSTDFEEWKEKIQNRIKYFKTEMDINL